MMIGDVTAFTAVDHSKDPDFFRRFLDRGSQLPGIVASKPHILEEMRCRPGSRVLDVGCGLGRDAIQLASMVGPNGHVVGLDVSEAMIVEARQRAADCPYPVSFHVGDVQHLPFEDESFDACRAERTLMHVPDTTAATSEMLRVTKRGGRISIFDFDWDTHIIDSPHKETTRKITRSFADAMKNGWIGRQLPRLFRQLGMTEVTVSPHTIFIPYEFLELLIGGHLTNAQMAGLLTPAEVSEWWGALQTANEAGTFFCCFTAFIVAGTRSPR
jgi:ubiquinone/menaquinone biosynthesis C-methylase UbiE